MPKSKRELGWDNDKERQRLWIHVGSWDYKVFFESPAWHRSYFFLKVPSRRGRMNPVYVTKPPACSVDLFDRDKALKRNILHH